MVEPKSGGERQFGLLAGLSVASPTALLPRCSAAGGAHTALVGAARAAAGGTEPP